MTASRRHRAPGSDEDVDLSRLGSTFSALLIHVLMLAALAASPPLPPHGGSGGCGAGAGEAKDGCRLMGESGCWPALPPPERGLVGLVGVPAVAEARGGIGIVERRLGQHRCSSSRAAGCHHWRRCTQALHQPECGGSKKIAG